MSENDIKNNKSYNTKLIVGLIILALIIHDNPELISLLFIGIIVIAYFKFKSKITESTDNFCSKCGTKIEHNSNFCSKCGNKI